MGLDSYTGIIVVGYGGKLLIGPNYICSQPENIKADVIIATSDKNECPRVEGKRHWHFEVKNRDNSNSRYQYRAAVEQVNDSLLVGKRVLVHSPEHDRGNVVVAGALFMIKAYPSFEDALWHVVKKHNSGKPLKELIEMAQSVLYDKPILNAP